MPVDWLQVLGKLDAYSIANKVASSYIFQPHNHLANMSERANFRGGRGRGDRGGRGNDRGGRGGGHAGAERKKENILDLSKYMDKDISVKFNGGREGVACWIAGVRILTDLHLSDWDTQGLRSADESGSGQCQGDDKRFVCQSHVLKSAADGCLDEEGNTSSRTLGLLVVRGTLLVLISPLDGSEEIANPFVQADDDDDE